MHGNLYEWCSDWFGNDYGLEEITDATAVPDPTGPASGYSKVLKGGSWYTPTNYLRSGYRNPVQPENCSDSNGFRVVFNAE